MGFWLIADQHWNVHFARGRALRPSAAEQPYKPVSELLVYPSQSSLRAHAVNELGAPGERPPPGASGLRRSKATVTALTELMRNAKSRQIVEVHTSINLNMDWWYARIRLARLPPVGACDSSLAFVQKLSPIRGEDGE